MTLNHDHHQVRKLKNGDWYWIQKAVIQEYAARIGPMAVMVYNLLASQADRCQSCFPSQKYMAERLGCSRSTVNKAVKTLAAAGLIGIEKRSRYHLVYTLLTVRCRAGKTEMSEGGNPDVAPADTNDNKVTINNNDIDNDMKNLDSADRSTVRDFTPRTKEELLALDLARGLDDLKALPLYLAYARKYSEGALRRALSEARAVPAAQIKKSRGALFNHLIQKYGG
jgi:biotin operon repressor